MSPGGTTYWSPPEVRYPPSSIENVSHRSDCEIYDYRAPFPFPPQISPNFYGRYGPPRTWSSKDDELGHWRSNEKRALNLSRAKSPLRPGPAHFSPKLVDQQQSDHEAQKSPMPKHSAQQEKAHDFVFISENGDSSDADSRKPKRRGPLPDVNKVAKVRSVGACWRCRLLKKTVRT